MYENKSEVAMTRKMHHLVAATDHATLTRLTNIYAATFEEAWREAVQWQQDHCPELYALSVIVQPQGFRAGFTCLPGFIDEEEEGDEGDKGKEKANHETLDIGQPSVPIY